MKANPLGLNFYCYAKEIELAELTFSIYEKHQRAAFLIGPASSA
jgi:hypothetical protein